MTKILRYFFSASRLAGVQKHIKIRATGCSNAVAEDCRITSVFSDRDVTVNVATRVGDLSLSEMRKISHDLRTYWDLSYLTADG